MIETKKISPVGAVIFYTWRNKFLLILRDNKPDILFPNTWAPVTGGVEQGENICECAERESYEEIGIFPKKIRILGISAKGNGFFFGKLSDGEKRAIKLGEGQRYNFFGLHELYQIQIGGAFKIYLEKFPEVFTKIAETGYEPSGDDFNLAVWST